MLNVAQQCSIINMLTCPPTQSRTLVITIWNRYKMWKQEFSFVLVLLLEQHQRLMRSLPPHCLWSRVDWTFRTQVQRPGVMAPCWGQGVLSTIHWRWCPLQGVNFTNVHHYFAVTVLCHSECVILLLHYLKHYRGSVHILDGWARPDGFNGAGLIREGRGNLGLCDHLFPP